MNKQNCEYDYYLILEYIKKKIEIGYKTHNEYWVHIIYERYEWFINFNSITTFAWEPNGRITFWLPDSTKDIIINPNNDLEAYEKVLKFVNKVTGNSLP